MMRFRLNSMDGEMEQHPAGEWIHIDDVQKPAINARVVECATEWGRIFMSGPIEVAKHILREECMREGLCVTIAPAHFIYTGGEEVGYVVGLNNYPRFPMTREAMQIRATAILEHLLAATHQHSGMLQMPHTTVWLTLRPGQ